MGIYNNVTYDRNKMYDEEIAKAVANEDYLRAGMLEQQRNAKIDGEKLSYDKTYDYSRYLEPGADSGFGISSPKSTKGADSGNGITADDEDYEYKGGRGFNYDPSEDRAYQGLVKQVQKNAEFVGDNTLGRFAAMTGGVPSSYAVSAAAGAQADVLDDIYDIYAEREGEAYNRYMTQDQIDYARYLDKLEREASEAAAEEDTRRWGLEYGLKEKQADADVKYTDAKTSEQLIANEYADELYEADLAGKEADTELTKAKTTAQETENDYAGKLNEAEIARIYADTDLTKAKTAGQALDNYYAPFVYASELSGEGETGADEVTIEKLVDKANSGAYLTDSEYAMLERAKENILTRVGGGLGTGGLTDEEINILRVFGYTSGQLAKPSGLGYDSNAGTFTAPKGTASAKNFEGFIGDLEKNTHILDQAAKGYDQLVGFLELMQPTVGYDEATINAIIKHYENKMGW